MWALAIVVGRAQPALGVPVRANVYAVRISGQYSFSGQSQTLGGGARQEAVTFTATYPRLTIKAVSGVPQPTLVGTASGSAAVSVDYEDPGVDTRCSWSTKYSRSTRLAVATGEAASSYAFVLRTGSPSVTPEPDPQSVGACPDYDPPTMEILNFANAKTRWAWSVAAGSRDAIDVSRDAPKTKQRLPSSAFPVDRLVARKPFRLELQVKKVLQEPGIPVPDAITCTVHVVFTPRQG
jgi:hypothetical protein